MFLKEVADNYIVEILPIEERAKILIKHFRDNHKNDSLSENDTLHAPQGKLIEFQNERDSIVSRYRDRLRELFGEEDFQRFDLKLKQDTSANTRMMTLDEVREKIREEKNKKDSSQPTENLQKNNGSKGGQ